MFYRRDFYEKAGVDPASIKTWDDFIAAGKKIQEANPGVTMTNADFNGDSEFFRMISNEQGCGYFAADGQSITVNQPDCVDALTKIKEMKDAGIITSADWGDQDHQQHRRHGRHADVWRLVRRHASAPNRPDGNGKWGVYLMPSLTADGPRAANLGGSSLAITSASKNKEAAYAYLKYTLETNEGQITMLKEFGLVPSLISALDDPYVSRRPALLGRPGGVEGHPRHPAQDRARAAARRSRATPKSSCAPCRPSTSAGGYPDAKAALDDAANQIAAATGLPIAQ